MRYIAVPVSAPWLKLSEAIDFVRAAQPDHLFRHMTQSYQTEARRW